MLMTKKRASRATPTTVGLPEAEKYPEVTRAAVVAQGLRCRLIPGDVQDSAFCEQAVEATVETFGAIDILVNNAAYQQHQTSIDAISDEQLERTFRVNIFGYCYMARAAVRRMSAGSAIVNTGSITGLEGSGKLLDYAATKGAIHAFTKSLALSFASNVDSSYVTGEVSTLLGGGDDRRLSARTIGGGESEKRENPEARPTNGLRVGSSNSEQGTA